MSTPQAPRPGGPAAPGAPQGTSSAAANAGPRPMMRGPMGAGFGPPQKAKSFKASARRLLGRLAPQRRLILFVLVFAITSVALNVSGPKILGRATAVGEKLFKRDGLILRVHRLLELGKRLAKRLRPLQLSLIDEDAAEHGGKRLAV